MLSNFQKKRYNRKSFEVKQKQSLLSDSDDDNKEDSEHCIIGEKRSIGRSQWVQCDNPECQKWRRIDYVIDIDEVESAKWVCEMNKGMPLIFNSHNIPTIFPQFKHIIFFFCL